MDLYFLLCGTLTILISFGVFEKVLKSVKLNRWLVCCFLLLSCVFSAIEGIKIYGMNISLNLILYGILFIFLFFKQRTAKSFISCLIASLLVIAVLVCYRAINLSGFEYAYVQPYVYVAIVFGIVIYYLCPNFYSAFCGVFLGNVVFELLFHELSLSYSNEILQLGSTLNVTFTFVCMIVFSLFSFFASSVKSLKNRKKQEKVNL